MSFHGVVIDVDLCGWETRSRGVGLVLPLSGAGIVGSGEAVVGTERMRVRRRAGLVSAAGNPVPARPFATDAAVAPGASATEEAGGAPVSSRGEAGEEA